MDCKLCDENASFYIGETRRSVRLRYNEHIRDARNRKEDTPFGFHQTKHPDIQLGSDNISIQILHVSKDGPDRKIWESIYIRDLKPTLNTQTSSWSLIRRGTWAWQTDRHRSTVCKVYVLFVCCMCLCFFFRCMFVWWMYLRCFTSQYLGLLCVQKNLFKRMMHDTIRGLFDVNLYDVYLIRCRSTCMCVTKCSCAANCYIIWRKYWMK